MQRARSCISDLIKTFDVFTSPVCLRYDKEPDYDTFTGGCFSIAMIIILISVFFNQWIDILNYAVIYANQQTVRQFDPSKLVLNTDQFMFALGVIGIDLNSNDTKYVDISMQAYWRDINKTNHVTNVPLQPCTVDHWTKFGPEFQSTFNRMEIKTFLCPPRNYQLYFQGKFTSQNFAYIKITFSRCIGIGCKTTAQFEKFIAKNQAFRFDIFYTNTLLNKDQLEPTDLVFEDKTYLMTSHQLGINMNIYVSEYEMKTDKTLWPWSDQQVITGLIVDKNDNQQWNFIPKGNSMTKVYFRKSDNKIYINRSFRKVDDMLSYIGGLFGIIALLFGVLMTYYSQCSYQLALSSSIFEYKVVQDESQGSNNGSNENIQEDKKKNQMDQIIQDQFQSKYQKTTSHSFQKKMKQYAKKTKKQIQPEYEQLDPSVFNFWDYLRYLFFLALKHIGCKPNWKKMVMYDDTIDQMRNQMNINTLLQKVAFFDKAIQTLFDQQQLKLLYLQEKYNIIDIKKQRQMLGLGLSIVNMFVQDDNLPKEQKCMYQKRLDMPVGLNNQQSISRVSLISQNNFINKQSLRSLRRLSGNQFNALFNELIKGNKNKDGIPQQIVQALEKLTIKISNGDQVSRRIYEGLDPFLIQKYENRDSQQKKKNKTHKIRSADPDGNIQRTSIMRNQPRQSSFMGLLGLKRKLNIVNSYNIHQ